MNTSTTVSPNLETNSSTAPQTLDLSSNLEQPLSVALNYADLKPSSLTKAQKREIILKAASGKQLPILAPGMEFYFRGVLCRVQHFGRKLAMIEIPPGPGRFLSMDDFDVKAGPGGEHVIVPR